MVVKLWCAVCGSSVQYGTVVCYNVVQGNYGHWAGRKTVLTLESLPSSPAKPPPVVTIVACFAAQPSEVYIHEVDGGVAVGGGEGGRGGRNRAQFSIDVKR